MSGEVPAYKYGSSTPAFGDSTGANTPTASVNKPGYGAQESQLDGGKGIGVAVGGSGVEEIVESGSGVSSGGGGRKKKKKHKSGEESSTSKSCVAVADEELVDAVLPLLSDSQGSDVEELLFPSTLPPSGGTMVGGQYILTNSLADQILTEKKMQILQSPEVIEFLRKQLAKK